MTLRSRIFGLFPTLHGALALASFAWAVWRPTWTAALAIPTAIYLLPLLCFRVHRALWPTTRGVSDLAAPGYSPWWGAHQFQRLFMAVPSLEAVLRLVPGLFSLWLRAWGNKVGRGVVWTPVLDLLDRTHIEIGDGVVFGHRVTLSTHIVARRKDRMILHIEPIVIGDAAFVGAGAVLGPGVEVEAGANVEAGTRHYPRTKVSA